MKITLALTNPEELPEPPEHPGGGMWPFLLVSDEEVTFADSNTELLGTYIEGYEDLGEDPDGNAEATMLRYEQAVVTANLLQVSICAEATRGGTFNPATVSEGELTALFTDCGTPFTGTEDASGMTTTEWTLNVPLVLIDMDYAPFSDRPRPTGNVLFLRPSVETTYLESLDEVGMVVYRIADLQAT